MILLKYLLSHGQLGQALKLLDHVLDKRLTEVEAVWSVLDTGGCSPYCHRMVCKHLAQYVAPACLAAGLPVEMSKHSS